MDTTMGCDELALGWHGREGSEPCAGVLLSSVPGKGRTGGRGTDGEKRGVLRLFGPKQQPSKVKRSNGRSTWVLQWAVRQANSVATLDAETVPNSLAIVTRLQDVLPLGPVPLAVQFEVREPLEPLRLSMGIDEL
jgi:hypothetical protein